MDPALQVCLAAEECGHLNFDSRTDMWWNGDAFHCGSGPRGAVPFHDIFFKVCHLLCLHWSQDSLSTQLQGSEAGVRAH